MLLGARIFVGFVYLLLALSFLATTATLFHEFHDAGWFDQLTTNSHLFLFFPAFGIVALVAFYLPSVIFVDLYWRHVPWGKTRFISGFFVLAVLSYAIASLLLATHQRSPFEIAPQTLLADQGEPARCAASATGCERLPVIVAMHNLRLVSQSRIGLRDFIRNCHADPLVEAVPGSDRKRFCFASSASPLAAAPRLATDAECCRAEQRLSGVVNSWFADDSKRSLTGRVHAALLPLKVFFLLILLVISLILALRHQSIVQYYRPWLDDVEFGVLIGAVAAIFFPFMSQAFLQSSMALWGASGGTFSAMIPALSLAFGAWTLLILLFFYRRRDKQLELAAKMIGAAGSVIAVIKYDDIVSLFVRITGSGAGVVSVAVMLLLCLGAVIGLLRPWLRAIRRKERHSAVDRVPVEANSA